MPSVGSKQLSLKYQSSSGSKEGMIRKLEFVAKTQFLCVLQFWEANNDKTVLILNHIWFVELLLPMLQLNPKY